MSVFSLNLLFPCRIPAKVRARARALVYTQNRRAHSPVKAGEKESFENPMKFLTRQQGFGGPGQGILSAILGFGLCLVLFWFWLCFSAILGYALAWRLNRE